MCTAVANSACTAYPSNVFDETGEGASSDEKEIAKNKHFAYLGVQVCRISLLTGTFVKTRVPPTSAASERIMAVTVTCSQCGYRASASLPRGNHLQGGLPSLLVLLSFSLSPHLLSCAQCSSLFVVFRSYINFK